MPALVTLKADEKYYILINKDNTIRAFDSVRQALDYFEDGYRDSHARGYEASMSACLNYISFEYSVHEWNEEDCKKLVEMNVIDPMNFKGCRLSSISGFARGATLTGEHAASFHESGIAPKLL